MDSKLNALEVMVLNFIAHAEGYMLPRRDPMKERMQMKRDTWVLISMFNWINKLKVK